MEAIGFYGVPLSLQVQSKNLVIYGQAVATRIRTEGPRNTNVTKPFIIILGRNVVRGV